MIEMIINWKLRLKNKVTLTSLVALIVAIVYQVLNMIGIIPNVEQQAVLDLLCRCIDVLALVGIVVDPTTAGASDSSQALSYEEPRYEYIEREDDDRSDGEEVE